MLRRLWTRALTFEPREIHGVGLSQLYQTMLYAWVEDVELGGFGKEMGEMVLQATIGADEGTMGNMMEEYSELLTEMGFEHEREVMPLLGSEDAGGFLAIDLANREKKVAVELDGKSASVWQRQGRRRTKMKKKRGEKEVTFSSGYGAH